MISKQQFVNTVDELCERIAAIPSGEVYRHNDAGDLPAKGVAHTYQFTAGRQKKTGHAHRSRTSRNSCPASCALFDICYASVGPISWHWKKMSGEGWNSSGAKSLDQSAVLKIARTIGASKLIAWTYTHWDWKKYKRTFAEAIRAGFCINVSVEDPREAIDAFAAGLPVALVAPPGQTQPLEIEGVPVFCCPALLPGSTVTCDKCGNGTPLCARPDRPYIIAFPAHGMRAPRVWERIAPLWDGFVDSYRGKKEQR